MSRNKNQISREIFSKLISFASLRGSDVISPDKMRYIKKLSPDDDRILTHGNCFRFEPARYVRFARIALEQHVFIVVVGAMELERNFDMFEKVELTPAFFSIVLKEFDLHPLYSIVPEKIKEILDEFYVGAREDYSGHDLDDIVGFFAPMSVFKISPNCSFGLDFRRVCGALLLSGSFDHILSGGESLRDRLFDLFMNGNDNIPFGSIVSGLLSASWDAFYLQLYRCIENLFGVDKVHRLKIILQLEGEVFDLLDVVRDNLLWRDRESDSIVSLLSMCDRSELYRIDRYRIGSIIETAGDNEIGAKNNLERVAKKMYRLRNLTVHFRRDDSGASLTSGQWGDVCFDVIDVIEILYSKLFCRIGESSQLEESGPTSVPLAPASPIP